MITNDVQFRTTKSWLARFEAEAAEVEERFPTDGRSRLQQLQIDSARAQADDLRVELADYELLKSGSTRTFEASSLRGLADALIKARIARGWTQRRLADELGIAEQQVQRYESTGYSAASLARLADITEALGVTVTETITLIEPAAFPSILEPR
jgi:ribosome-binding protein aMBF1 (putative translation factor)